MASSDLAIVIGFIILLIIVLSLLGLLYVGWNKPNVRQFVMDQFRVIVCLPAAGLLAFLIVAIFQVSAGQIQFKIVGLEFSGAAGPVIMWILAFVAISTMIGTLWKKT